MGGPWRVRDFNAAAWRPPAAHIEGHGDSVGSNGTHDYLVGIVIGYIASVVTSIAIVLTLIKGGW